MRALLCCFMVMFCVGSVAAQQGDTPQREGAVLTFAKAGYDFGKIAAKGKNVSFLFEYTNTGNGPLMILKVITSCSCTKASFSKKPVKPGEQGVVKITFEPRTQHGTFCKLIDVYSTSVDGKKVIYLKGVVE